MTTICGIECNNCNLKDSCKGCLSTCGRPFGGECITAQCYITGGKSCFVSFKNDLIQEFNSLNLKGMPAITELYPLNGVYVNLEYKLPNGDKIKLLDNNKIYLGCQVKKTDTNRYYGLIADCDYLLVSEYDCNGINPEIVVYKKR